MRPVLARLTSVALSAALLPALVLTSAAHAQTALKNLSNNLGGDTWGGVMQASEGNFYTNSLVIGRSPIPYACQDDPANTCTYITKITPDGTATILHTFEQLNGQSNIDGMSPNPRDGIEPPTPAFSGPPERAV